MEKKLKWIKRWFEMAKVVSNWSQDPSTKVGAVLIPYESDTPIIGWNGFPRGVLDSSDRYDDREIKYKLVAHAESNCITNASRNGIKTNKSDMYVTHPPCNECSKLIVQAGIKNIYYIKPNPEMFERWKKSLEYSELILSEGGVRFHIYDE